VKRIVLDSSAVIAFIQNERGAEKIQELMTLALTGGRKLYLSVVNWGEIYYWVWRGNGQQAARQVAGEIERFPIEIINLDVELTRIAAGIRAVYKLPYADCFAAALAKQYGAEVVTSDKDFMLVEKEVDITFI